MTKGLLQVFKSVASILSLISRVTPLFKEDKPYYTIKPFSISEFEVSFHNKGYVLWVSNNGEINAIGSTFESEEDAERAIRLHIKRREQEKIDLEDKDVCRKRHAEKYPPRKVPPFKFTDV